MRGCSRPCPASFTQREHQPLNVCFHECYNQPIQTPWPCSASTPRVSYHHSVIVNWWKISDPNDGISLTRITNWTLNPWTTYLDLLPCNRCPLHTIGAHFEHLIREKQYDAVFTCNGAGMDRFDMGASLEE